jgi:hypothetical protein
MHDGRSIIGQSGACEIQNQSKNGKSQSRAHAFGFLNRPRKHVPEPFKTRLNPMRKYAESACSQIAPRHIDDGVHLKRKSSRVSVQRNAAIGLSRRRGIFLLGRQTGFRP